MKHFLTFMKIPFIIFFALFIHSIYTEIGTLQQASYTMDVQHFITFFILGAFLVYGLYAALRDVLLLLFMESAKNRIQSVLKDTNSVIEEVIDTKS